MNSSIAPAADRRGPAAEERPGSALEVAAAFLKLGLSSFGGPIAHLGYFRREFVERRRWLDEEHFGELLGLCQFLPGPASSQLGFCLGLQRAGWPGALAAFAGFTLPSALLLYALAVSSTYLAGPWGLEAVHGLKLVAVAVVAQAVFGMARTLTPDAPRALLAAAAAGLTAVGGSASMQLLVVAGRRRAGSMAVPADHAAPERQRRAALRPAHGKPAAADVRHSADLRAHGRARGSPARSGGRRVLPRRRAGVRRRPCGPPTAQAGGG